jgi:hypothetical protein
VESAVDGLKRRAGALAVALRKRNRTHEAAELTRRLELFARADDLHRHAESLDILVDLYRALAVFAEEREPTTADSIVWAQTGALDDDAPPVAHGPAFRETAALRNRAFRLVASAVARYAHQA